MQNILLLQRHNILRILMPFTWKAKGNRTKFERSISSEVKGRSEKRQTVLCSNGVIACWHPSTQFPFEHSRPFDMEKALFEKEKFLNRKTDEIVCTRGPDDLALREIFYTDMHEWRPKHRERKLYRAKVDDELKPVLSNPLELPAAPVIADKSKHTKRCFLVDKLIPSANFDSFVENNSLMIQALFFGRVPYLTGLHVQECLFRRLIADKDSKGHFLCLFEHSPTYTIGIRQEQYSEEFAQQLLTLGAEFHRIKRGGLITFHGPGQLVVYPIFNLRKLSLVNKTNGMGVRRFVELVEETVIQTVQHDFGLRGVGRTRDPGVWVDLVRKVAAIGIQVRHGVTSHGLALNCDTDLAWFDQIVPCGLHGKFVTSISKELGRSVSVSEVIGPICAQFEKQFKVPLSFEEGHRAEEFLTECGGKREEIF